MRRRGPKPTACARCFSLHAACDRASPCSRCVSAGEQCVSRAHASPKTKKRNRPSVPVAIRESLASSKAAHTASNRTVKALPSTGPRLTHHHHIRPPSGFAVPLHDQVMALLGRVASLEHAHRSMLATTAALQSSMDLLQSHTMALTHKLSMLPNADAHEDRLPSSNLKRRRGHHHTGATSASPTSLEPCGRSHQAVEHARQAMMAAEAMSGVTGPPDPEGDFSTTPNSSSLGCNSDGSAQLAPLVSMSNPQSASSSSSSSSASLRHHAFSMHSHSRSAKDEDGNESPPGAMETSFAATERLPAHLFPRLPQVVKESPQDAPWIYYIARCPSSHTSFKECVSSGAVCWAIVAHSQGAKKLFANRELKGEWMHNLLDLHWWSVTRAHRCMRSCLPPRATQKAECNMVFQWQNSRYEALVDMTILPLKSDNVGFLVKFRQWVPIGSDEMPKHVLRFVVEGDKTSQSDSSGDSSPPGSPRGALGDNEPKGAVAHSNSMSFTDS